MQHCLGNNSIYQYLLFKLCSNIPIYSKYYLNILTVACGQISRKDSKDSKKERTKERKKEETKEIKKKLNKERKKEETKEIKKK